jgi:drug/metabolite transporter (DMT)-like permease
VLLTSISAVYSTSGWSGVVSSSQQKSLQAGSLVADQPALTLSNPVVAMAFGVVVFGERVRTGGWLALAVAGALLIAVSTAVLARSPLLRGG